MLIGSKIINLDSTVSTNNYASAILPGEDITEGTVVRTRFQTGGRGQEGNKWESQRDKNLLISIILFPKKIAPSGQFAISMAVSAGICSFLSGYLPDVRIKWPNDIYCRDDKIAGILIECAISGNTISHAIAGIGININQTSFPDKLPNPVSMKLITSTDYDIESIMTGVLREIDSRYRLMMQHGRRAVEEEYLSMLYRKDEWHMFESGGYEFNGKITGIDNTGCLIVTDESGVSRSYMFKEIAYLQ